MLNKFLFWGLGFMFAANLSSIEGKIVESNQIQSVHSLIEEDTLVLFNTSDVLYEHTSSLAEAQWREHFADRVRKEVSDKNIAEKIINHVRGILVTGLPQKNVEDITPKLVEQLQGQKVPVIGVTQKRVSAPYAKNFAEITSGYLTNLGINLEKTLAFTHFKDRESHANFSFAYGIIFTNNKPVGPAICSFLESNDYHPRKIVMVDNSHDELYSAQLAVEEQGIEFAGLRYGAADERKTDVDLTVGTIEFFALINDDAVMVDEEAIRIKQTSDIDYEVLLGQYIQAEAAKS